MLAVPPLLRCPVSTCRKIPAAVGADAGGLVAGRRAAADEAPRGSASGP